jgi:hypothetical protein
VSCYSIINYELTIFTYNVSIITLCIYVTLKVMNNFIGFQTDGNIEYVCCDVVRSWTWKCAILQTQGHSEYCNCITIKHFKYNNIINTAMNVVGSKNIQKYTKQVTKCMHYITILACSLCYNHWSIATGNCRADTRISLKCCCEWHEGWLHSFLTSAVDGSQQSASAVDRGQQSASAVDRGQQSDSAVDRGQQSASAIDRGQQSASAVDSGQQSASVIDRGQQSASTVDRGQQSGSAVDRCQQSASAVDRGQQSASHPGHFTSRDDPWELLVRGVCRPGSLPENFREEKNLLPQPEIKLQFHGCTASGNVITLIGPARGQQKHKLYEQQVSAHGM